MPAIEFQPMHKTHRLFRDITITEKIDGTNAAINIRPGSEEGTFEFTAQSKNRVIVPGMDNYGFASWVHDNAHALLCELGMGLHRGEWWGEGIQRRYGLTERRFSLFNTHAHRDVHAVVDGVRVEPAPVLFQGTFSEAAIRDALNLLKVCGSVAAPGFMDPEGVCVYHSQTKTTFKVTLDNNDAGKWEK